jgi:hypothetical protein
VAEKAQVPVDHGICRVVHVCVFMTDVCHRLKHTDPAHALSNDSHEHHPMLKQQKQMQVRPIH